MCLRSLGSNAFVAVYLALAAMLMLTGITTYFMTMYMAREKLIRQMVIDSPQSPGFEKFVNKGETTVRHIFVPNVLNAEEFSKGQHPQLRVEFLGPFVFDFVMYRRNVTFLSGGSRVGFDSQYLAYYRPEQSAAVDIYRTNVTVPSLDMVTGYTRLGPSVDNYWCYRILTHFRAAPQRWLDPEHCATPAICSVARYYRQLGVDPQITPGAAAHLIGHLTANFTHAIGFMLMLRGLNDAALPASYRAALLVQARSFPGLSFGLAPPAPDHAKLLLDYFEGTRRAILAAYFRDYGLPRAPFFARQTIHQYLLLPDPLGLLNLNLGIFNDTLGLFKQYNVVRTGSDNEFYIGMDYFEIINNVTHRFEYGVNVSVIGRTFSIPPFLGFLPKIFSAYFHFIGRRVLFRYSSESREKGLIVAHYRFNFDDLMSYSDEYQNYIKGSLNIAPVLWNIPVHASVPFMELVRPELRDIIYYTNKKYVLSKIPEHFNMLAIEPITGSPLRHVFSLQNSLLINKSLADNYLAAGVDVLNIAKGQDVFFIPHAIQSYQYDMDNETINEMSENIFIPALFKFFFGFGLISLGFIFLLLGACYILKY